MSKSRIDFIQVEENQATAAFHSADSKGRQKQTDNHFTKQYESFENWDEVEIETFQKFSKRGRR